MSHASPQDKPLYDLINNATPLEGAYFCMFGQATTTDDWERSQLNIFTQKYMRHCIPQENGVDSG